MVLDGVLPVLHGLWLPTSGSLLFVVCEFGVKGADTCSRVDCQVWALLDEIDILLVSCVANQFEETAEELPICIEKVESEGALAVNGPPSANVTELKGLLEMEELAAQEGVVETIRGLAGKDRSCLEKRVDEQSYVACAEVVKTIGW